ncbi:YidB family protein [Hellea balneolensis]|uniref:YidB family protein n=1 Tax=Hellea balneolensis TaxID=287478 RepID=UPI000A057819|nr:YidB family protein [Hellea balneolensis]
MTMDIMNLAKGMLAQKLGGNSDAVGDVMNSLLGQGDKMDIGSLVSGFKDKGLGDVAESWLGDGENAPVSADQLKEVLGGDQVAAAAEKLGTDEGSLLGGLQDALPQLIDKASSGGSLLDSVGGLGGLGGMAKKFL